MSTTKIPTLAVEGWISNKNIQMGKLFEYFLASDYSQSNTFHGEISSLKHILASYTNINTIADDIKNSLSLLYDSYYDNVVVDVNVTTEDNHISYEIEIIAESDGKRYTLSKNIKESNGSIINFDILLDNIYKNY